MQKRKIHNVLSKLGVKDYKVFFALKMVVVAWFIIYYMMVMVVFGCFFLLGIILPIKILFLLSLIYFISSLVISLYLNNSIAINSENIIRLNPYFSNPCIVKLKEVKKIEISNKSSHKYFLYFFLIHSHYHIKIETEKKVFYFYCVGLEEDYFERPTNKNTLDDLQNTLEGVGVKVINNC